MSVSKSWAYVSEFGRERITAWAISRERAKYDGKPLGRTYWSTHKPGRRKPVKHVQKGATAFFAYINPADAVDGGDGESLSHRLLKEAIAGLSGTTLRLGNQGEHHITITHGETEKLVPTVEGTFYADAYLRFTSNTTLGLRWSEELYVEVHHTHAVPVDKQKELRRSRVPVVEVPLLDAFDYPHEDENTSDPREAAHVARIRNMLEKGFLAGRVISDRRSIEFLEQEVTRLAASLREARSGWDAEKKSAAQVADQLALARARAAELEKQRSDNARDSERLVQRLDELKQEFDAEKVKVGVLTGELAKAQATIAQQRKKVRLYWIAGGAVLALGLGGVLGYWRFLKTPLVAQNLPELPAVVSPAAKSAVAHLPKAPAKHATRTTMARRHRAPTSAPVIDDGEVDATTQ